MELKLPKLLYFDLNFAPLSKLSVLRQRLVLPRPCLEKVVKYCKQKLKRRNVSLI